MRDNEDALSNLEKLKNEIFDRSDEKLALALGRPIEEVNLWFQGGEIDEDAQEKINGLAQERLSA
ncbi:MAG: hypothetical protein LH472_10375 [Pyrinomonadaceae bacterium]|nr:hypothetical protein [Pyrinomonadaceae bacterium]